ncbi:hypothetical protein Emag_004194 [Eimeria magna]
MTVVYSLSRYFARRHNLGEFDQRNVGQRLPRAPTRTAEPPSFLRRIDTWCPAKSYSAVLDDYNASNGGPPPPESPSGGPLGGPPGSANGAAGRPTEIEMTDRGGPSSGRSVGPPGASGAPLSDAEKEGLGRFIESGGPPPPTVPTAARGGSGAPPGAPQSVAERFISFRFFSFPGRLRQQQ